MPRVIQHKNVQSLTFPLNDFTWMRHCWLPQERFDEVRFAGNWGSFDSFVKVLNSASIEVDGLHGAIVYESPSIGRFVTGWEVKPTANDVPIELSRYPLVDSAWAHSDFGSGEMVLRHGDEVYELWFNQ